MVRTGCCCINVVDPRSLVQYSDSMVHSNKGCVPMNLIPTDTRSPLVPIMGKAQQEAAVADLTTTVMETLQALLDEDEEEYSEYEAVDTGEEEEDSDDCEDSDDDGEDSDDE